MFLLIQITLTLTEQEDFVHIKVTTIDKFQCVRSLPLKRTNLMVTKSVESRVGFH